MKYTEEDVEKATETLQGYLEGVRNNERLHASKQMIQALCDNFVNKMNKLLTMTTEERKIFVGDSLDIVGKLTQPNTSINTSQQNGIFGTHGWVCPKCGRVYSPYQNMCLYCKNEEYE